MRIKLVLIAFISAFFSLQQFVFGIYDSISDSAPQFVSNQLIVAYKKGQSIQQLTDKVDERERKRRSFWGLISIFLTDASSKVKNKKTPEQKLEEIILKQEQIGVVETQKLSVENQSGGETYLYTIDGSIGVDKAIKLFETLPSVEYAEPNYLYDTLKY